MGLSEMGRTVGQQGVHALSKLCWEKLSEREGRRKRSDTLIDEDMAALLVPM
jgi:hypothetical protein